MQRFSDIQPTIELAPLSNLQLTGPTFHVLFDNIVLLILESIFLTRKFWSHLWN